MKRSNSITLIFAVVSFAISGSSLSAATTVSYSFWAYDQYAGNSPYYSHYQVSVAGAFDPAMAGVSLMDRGLPGNVYSIIESGPEITGPVRTVGWHQYEFYFNLTASTATILMDGNPIQSGPYVRPPSQFRFLIHDYYGGTQETVIDDFQFKVDGVVVYETGFESSTLDPEWTVSKLDVGTYVTSGDTSTPHSGNGSLAIGTTTGGNLVTMVDFVPEPSALLFSGLTIIGACCRRNRKFNAQKGQNYEQTLQKRVL